LPTTIKKNRSWLTVSLTSLFAVPLLYNSCQKMKAASTGSSATQASVCRVENGKIRLQQTSDLLPSPFATRKVVLDAGISGANLKQKTASGPITQGTPLTVILDNECLRASVNAPSDFLSKILGPAKPHSSFLRQAYPVSFAQDISQAQVEAMANAEPCLIGLSWERKYKTQSVMSFNDTNAFRQTHLNSINAFAADALFYDAQYGIAESSSTPIKIAVLDSGVDYNHPDLSANIWQNAYGPGIDITTLNSGTVSYDPMDASDIGHGTHVSGLVAAVSNNSLGIIGTMPFNAQIMAVKVFSNASGTLSMSTSDLYNGIQFAYLNGASVINLSIESSGTEYDSVTQAGLTEAVNNGVTVAVAMGNGDPTGQLVDAVNNRVVPAVYSAIAGVIGVASFDASSEQLSSFSNYSTTYAEIAAPGASAPGSGIYSTIPLSLSAYGTLMGTSQATPIVSAAAGLTIALIKQAYGIAPSPKEVERLILTSAIKSPALAGYVANGNRLDLLSLVNTIRSEYPRTMGQGSATLPAYSGCN
jgi:subtilisin family serine protease